MSDVLFLILGVVMGAAGLVGLIAHIDRRLTRSELRREFRADPSPWVMP